MIREHSESVKPTTRSVTIQAAPHLTCCYGFDPASGSGNTRSPNNQMRGCWTPIRNPVRRGLVEKPED